MTNTGLQKSVKAVGTQRELAKVAGVSHDAIHKVEKIEEKAPKRIKIMNSQSLLKKLGASMPLYIIGTKD